MKQLNQVIAVEKSIKSRCFSAITNIHKTNGKIENFNGFSKTYRSKDEDGELYPQENKKVLTTSTQQINEAKENLIELFDITATKDYANCKAAADIIVEGKVIAKSVPASFLLFLEKQLNDIRTFAENIPTLDPAEDWNYDINSGVFKTNPITTHKMKKTTKPITLSEATKEHAAQVQLISEDIVIGYWDTTKYSGAMPIPKKATLLDRINKLSIAVKAAREKANTVDIEMINISKTIFDYIFVSQAES